MVQSVASSKAHACAGFFKSEISDLMLPVEQIVGDV
jgi:hypothetical protein